MDKVYGVTKARAVNQRSTLVLTIPKEAREDLGIKVGDKFVVGLGREGLTYQKRKE